MVAKLRKCYYLLTNAIENQRILIIFYHRKQYSWTKFYYCLRENRLQKSDLSIMGSVIQGAYPHGRNKLIFMYITRK